MKISLKKGQIDVLDAGDAVFDRENAKTLCLYPDLHLSEMEFSKVVVNGHLVEMEEAKPFPSDDLIQEDCVAISNP